MRGFDIFWFRMKESEAAVFKERVTLPSLPINYDVVVKNQKCFLVEKQDGIQESRKLCFL